ncbi:hypothetical protein, partial [Escherichia coli]|uniref:hypothetical protein n=3 Tax=Escherichia coli TaxID=562 RepID=UPI00196B53F3
NDKLGAFQFKLRREGTLCFLVVLCCGENITFNQVAKFTVPLQPLHIDASIFLLTSLTHSWYVEKKTEVSFTIYPQS